MKMPCRAPSTCLQLDYVRDTLFGPVAKRVECHVQVAAVNLQGRPGMRLLVCAPVPDKLDRSHSVAFVWEGHSYHGVVRDHVKCGSGALKLVLELQ